MNRRKGFFLIAGTLMLLMVLGIWLIAQRNAPLVFSVQQLLAKFTEKGVDVKVVMEKDQTGQTWLAGTFTPTQPRFHLYSKDLPRTGLGGVGRPTLLEVVAPADLRPSGALQANQPTQDLYLDILQQTFPVYPDGAVTVRLPVDKPNRAAIPIELAITYMACSDTTCLPPVENKHISATLHNP